MFAKLKEKFADMIEKVFLKVERSREAQRQKIRARRDAYLEVRSKERVKQQREKIRNINKERQESAKKLRRTFTTFKEYQEIAGAKLAKLEKLPQHERDAVVKRVMKLRREDENFRKALDNWAKQNYEMPIRRSMQKETNQNVVTI